MKLRRLEIENFGLFTDRSFDFDDGGFQLVFGTNEAGKSTLLQLVRELLFGFATRNAYAFADHAGEMAASAEIEMCDGTRFRFRRRKGRVNEVVGKVEPSGPAIDAARFARMLGVASPDLYQHVFGFSLAELSSGEKSLQDANLNEALYGGGLGSLANFQKVQATIQDEADNLFKPAAKKLTINKLVSRIKQTRKQLREATIKPRDYEKVRKECADREARKEQLREMVEKARRREAHLLRVSEALDPWLKQSDALAELEALLVPDSFPPDGAAQLSRMHAQQRDLAAELDEFEQELAEKNSSLAAIQLAPEIVQREADIRQLGRRVSEIEGYRRDIPLREQTASDIKAQVLRDLRKLNPQWDVSQLQKFETSLAQRDRVERLKEEFESLDLELREGRTQRTGIERELGNHQDALAELKESQVAEELESLVEGSSSYCSVTDKAADLASALRERKTKIQTLIARLNAPLRATIPFAEPLPVPLSPTVSEFRQRLTNLGTELRGAEQELAQAINDRQAKEQEVADLDAQQTVPDIQQLRAARELRDAGWALIRRKYINREQVTDREAEALLGNSDSLANSYEGRVADADNLADERQSKAEAVARRDQLTLELERIAGRVSRMKNTVADRQADFAAAERQWRALWSGCGFEPLSPEAMLDWLRDYNNLCDQQAELTAAQSEVEVLREKADRFEDRLRAAFAGSKKSPETLLSQATDAVSAARNADVARKTYESQVAEKLREQRALDEHLQQLQESHTAWQDKWSSLLEEFHFPADWDVRLATRILNGLSDARSQYESALGLDKRVTDMSSGVSQFERDVARHCESLAPDLANVPAENAVEQLTQRLDEAKQAARDKKNLAAEIPSLEARTERKRKQLDDVKAGIKQLFAAAKVESDEQFHSVAERATRRAELIDTIRDAKQQLRASRGTEDEAAFFAELQQSDKDTIDLEIGRTRDEIHRLDDEYTEAMNQAALQGDALRQMEAEGQVAALAMDLESANAELVDAVDRWVPLTLAQSLMKRAVVRFERQHQPAMLEDVRHLFSRMTMGRYVEIERKLDEQGTLQLVEWTGDRKEPRDLSTGTREQLYLAIRLAYIKHYCREAEPLPIVMDDVLVNFDAERARRTLEVLNEISRDVQIVFMTCHQHMVELVKHVLPDSGAICLSDDRSSAATTATEAAAS